MADERIYFLNESDRDDLDAMLSAYRQSIVGGPGGRHPPYDRPNQSTQVYVALTPPDGIPPMRRHGAGGGGSGASGSGGAPAGRPEPGHAECDIYEIVEYPDDVVELVVVDQLSRRVYNIAETAVPGDKWIIISRDKFGAWLAQAPFEGGADGSGSGGSRGVRIKDIIVCAADGAHVVDGYLEIINGRIQLTDGHGHVLTPGVDPADGGTPPGAGWYCTPGGCAYYTSPPATYTSGPWASELECTTHCPTGG